jgi:hypothetical protein
MSTAPVPSTPTHSELANFDVDNSISGRHMGEMINNTSFLLGKNVANVCCSYPAQVELGQISTVAPHPQTFFDANYQWFYTRSPDVQFVFLETECWKSILLGQRIAYNMTLSASLPVGASYATPEDESSFRRNDVAMDQTGNTQFPSTRTGIIDVSGLSTTVPTLFSLNISGSVAFTPPPATTPTAATVASFRGGGISKINMQEVPLRFLNVSGVGQSGSSDIISVVPFRRIVDGDADQEFGLARILDQTVKAKTRVRNQWQIVNHQSTQPILSPIHLSGITAGNTTIWYNNTAAFSPVDFQTPGSATNNVFYIRTRNYTGAATVSVNSYMLYVRYRTELAAPAAGCNLRMTHRNEATGFTFTETVALPASTAWTTASYGPLTLECGEWIFLREQLVRLNFDAEVGVAGAAAGQVVYFSAFYLVEEEP